MRPLYWSSFPVVERLTAHGTRRRANDAERRELRAGFPPLVQEAYDAGVPAVIIAELTGVSRQCVYDTMQKERWVKA